MPSEALELVFRFKSENKQELAAMRQALSGLASSAVAGTASLVNFSQSHKQVQQSLTGSILKAELLTGAFIRLGAAVKNYVEDAARYAARTDQLAVVSDSLARVNNLSVQGVRNQAAEVPKLGITTQTSLEVTSRLIQARVDLSKAPALARVAQDAAKIAGINSSDALEKIITSIGAGTVRPLHQMGLMVNFQQAYGDYAAQGHKNAQALTQQEQAEARLQAVIRAGAGIYGTYEASQITAGGQMQSLSRYTDELKNKFGEGLQPVLFSIIGTMRSLTVVAGENIDKFQHITAATAAMAAGATTFAAFSAVPLPYRAGISALAAGGAYMATDKDPAQTQIDVSTDKIHDLNMRERVGLLTKDQADSARKITIAETRYRLATILKQRQDRGEFLPDTSIFTAEGLRDLKARGVNPEALARMTGHFSKTAYPDKFNLDGSVITGDELKHEFDPDPNGNLKPAPLDDDDANKAFSEAVKEKAKAYRSQVNSSALSLLSGTAKIDAQGKFMRQDLSTALQGFSEKQLASPEVGQLYG